MKKNLKGLSRFKTVDIKLFSTLLRTSSREVKKYCEKLFNIKKISFRNLTKKEYEKTILEIIQKIDYDNQNVLSKSRKKIWSRGWNENLVEYKKNNSPKNLIPKYYTKKNSKTFRLGGKFVKSKQKNFEVELLKIYRTWFFKKYLSNVDNIYEFGVGSASNLTHAIKIFPKKNFYGLDFVQPSVDLVNLISKRYKNNNINGILFDMTRPKNDLKINKNSAFFSVGAFEQLGNDIDKILNFWIKKKPKICLNLEPDIFFYNQNILEDYLALKFHKKRNYTSCLYLKLKNLEKKGKIKIIKKFRSPFGNFVFDAYNFFLWKVI